MTAPPDDRGQLDFLQHVQRIFDEGEFVATYKFALLIALVELAIERGDDTGAPLELDLHSIAEKFIEQYWPHAAPYGAADGAPVAGGIPGRSTRGAAGGALGLRPSRGRVGAALGEFEIHGECEPAVPGDTWRVKLPHSSLV